MTKNKIYHTIVNGADKFKVEILITKITITDIKNEKTYIINKYKNVFIGKNSKNIVNTINHILVLLF